MLFAKASKFKIRVQAEVKQAVRRLVSDRVGEIEYSSMRNLFLDADLDGSGALDRVELAGVIKKYHRTGVQFDRLTPTPLKYTFDPDPVTVQC